MGDILVFLPWGRGSEFRVVVGEAIWFSRRVDVSLSLSLSHLGLSLSAALHPHRRLEAKMSDQEFDLDKVHSETAKVSDLIGKLKYSFLRRDFHKVEEILVVREKKLNDEIRHWKREYDWMEEKHGEAALGQLLTEEEIGKCKLMLGVLEEKVAFHEEREKREGIKYEKLVKDVERLERQNMELVAKNSELDATRVQAERKLAGVKQKSKEFDLCATRLEEAMQDSISVQPDGGSRLVSGSKRKRGSFLDLKEVENDCNGKGLTVSSTSTSDTDCDSDTLNELVKG